MPIERTSNSRDVLSPGLMLLWRRKWLLFVVGALTTVAGYFVMRLLPEEYKVRAEIFVNRLAVFEDPVSPEAASTLLKSDKVLHKVRDAYVGKFGGAPPIYERFTNQFRTETKVLQDTAVRRAVSPVITLTVQARGKEESLFLMQQWTAIFTSEFGDFESREAWVKMDSARREQALIEGRIREAETTQAVTAMKLARLEKLLADKLDLLAPTELSYSPVTRPSMPVSLDRDSNSFQVALQSPEAPGARGRGLYRQLADLQLELAQAGPETTTQAATQRQISGVESVIADTEHSITGLQGEVATAQAEFTAAGRSIALESASLREMRRFIDRVQAIVATTAIDGTEGAGVAADVRILSQGVPPELRAWPKRSLVAVGIGAAVTLLLAFLLVLQNFMSGAEARSRD